MEITGVLISETYGLDGYCDSGRGTTEYKAILFHRNHSIDQIRVAVTVEYIFVSPVIACMPFISSDDV